MAGPLARLAELARPEQRAVLEQLPARIGLAQSAAVDDVRRRLEMAEAEISAATARLSDATQQNTDSLDAVRAAIHKDSRERAANKWIEKIQKDFLALTPREKEVIVLDASGLMNKQIAAKLGVTEITVKVHRGNVMRKMGARSLAELVRISDALELRRENNP